MPPRVLIVDDHRNSAEVLALGLRLHGCDTATAATANEAIKGIENEPFDLVVSDIRMPRMTGLELAAWIRREYPPVRIVLMTAYDLEKDERELAEKLRVRVLIKPVTAEMLAACYQAAVSESLPPC